MPLPDFDRLPPPLRTPDSVLAVPLVVKLAAELNASVPPAVDVTSVELTVSVVVEIALLKLTASTPALERPAPRFSKVPEAKVSAWPMELLGSVAVIELTLAVLNEPMAAPV